MRFHRRTGTAAQQDDGARLDHNFPFSESFLPVSSVSGRVEQTSPHATARQGWKPEAKPMGILIEDDKQGGLSIRFRNGRNLGPSVQKHTKTADRFISELSRRQLFTAGIQPQNVSNSRCPEKRAKLTPRPSQLAPKGNARPASTLKPPISASFSNHSSLDHVCWEQ